MTTVRPVRTRGFWLLLGAASLLIGGLLLSQHAESRALWAQRHTAQDALDAAPEIEADNQRLRASTISDAELERLRADHQALPRLRAELAALQKQTDTDRE